MNLQNVTTLRYVEKASSTSTNSLSKENIFHSKNDKELLKNELAHYLSNSAKQKVDLIIENTSDFKITPADVRTIANEQQIDNNHNNNSNTFILNKKIQENNNDCLIMKSSKDPQIIKIDNKQENIYKDNHLPHFNEYKNDLQSLLIMMTINSNYDEKEKESTVSEIALECKNQDANDKMIEKVTFNTEESNMNTINIPSQVPFLNIVPIIKELSYRQKFIAIKFFRKWKAYVTLKLQNRIFEERQQALDQFFNKLSKKINNSASANEPVQKAKLFARDYNTYQHRYKMQKHIIALQKAKLEEQHKIIDKLKYNNILENSRQSLDSMRDDIRKTYYDIDKHLKPKMKCLTNELKIKELEEPSLILHCLKVPQFLQRMEARAREREEKHAIIRERRRQIEEERLRLKQQAELAKAEMDKEEKMKRMKELRQKRKQEKIENIRKKQHAERMRALIVMADLHNERNLMIKYGMKPFKLLLEIKKDNIEKAKAHYNFQLRKNLFFHWMWYTEDMWFDRNYKAQDFCRKKLLKKGFSGLKKNHYEYVLKKQVADDYYDLFVSQLVFRKFRESVIIIKREFEFKWKKASVYYDSNIVFKTFTCWRTLPALNNLKREQDARKLKWREKVLLVVPDYEPPED